MFNITVPGEGRLSIAHTLKSEKYEHFVTDIRKYKTTVVPFEVGSQTGFVNRENKERFHLLHKFCKRSIKLGTFKKNISTLSILGSYYIFNNRNIENWEQPEYISAPMTNM